MKFPKISIKTKFWNESSLDAWKTRYEKLSWIYGMFCLAGFGIGLFRMDGIMTVVFFLPVLLSVLITISYNKREVLV